MLGCTFRLLDKEKEYFTFLEMFKANFDIKYTIASKEENPFKAKDNFYLACEINGQIAGVINIVFLKASVFEAIKIGKMTDDMCLTINDIAWMHEDSQIYAYVSSIFINEGFRNKYVGRELLNQAISYVKTISEDKKVSFLAICINSASIALHKTCGFCILRTNSTGDVVMYKSMNPE